MADPRSSFGHQARWNLAASVGGQIVALGFIALTSRLLGEMNFGYYIWITALPGMVVVFDMYLGLSLQNRLTEVVALGNLASRDRLVWGFIWGMYAVALAFITILVVLAAWVTEGPWSGFITMPSWVIWLGVLQVSTASLGVPLLVAGVGFNAHREVHRGAAWSLGLDLFAKVAFLTSLCLLESLAISIAVFGAATILAHVILTMRFMQVYRVSYQKPSVRLIKGSLGELRLHGNAREWASLRVADAFLKNSELIIGAFVLGAATIGNFAVIDRLSNALMLAANAAYGVLVPALAAAGALQDKRRMQRLTKKVRRLSVAGLVLFSVVFLLAGEWIASVWAGRPVQFPIIVLVLLCVRAWTRVLSAFHWNVLFGYKLVRGLLKCTVVAGVIYAALYYLLILRYGVTSILISQIVAQTVFIAMASRMEHKFHFAYRSNGAVA